MYLVETQIKGEGDNKMYNIQKKCTELAERLKKICEEKESTPYKIAKKAGISSSTMNDFLKGRSNPRIDTLLIICNQLEISMTDFFDEQEYIGELTKNENNLIKAYRGLSKEKRKQLSIYINMLEQYIE